MHPLLLETANRNKLIVDNLFASHEAAQVASSNSPNMAVIPKAKANNFFQGMLLLGVVIIAVKGIQYYHQWRLSELEEPRR